MAEFVERYLKDERLRIAYLGQGAIGINGRNAAMAVLEDLKKS